MDFYIFPNFKKNVEFVTNYKIYQVPWSIWYLWWQPIGSGMNDKTVGENYVKHENATILSI